MPEGVSLARRATLPALVATVLGAVTITLVLYAAYAYEVRERAGDLRDALLSASLNARDFLLTPRGGYDARVDEPGALAELVGA